MEHIEPESPEELRGEIERLHRAVNELSILNDLAKAISSTMDVKRIMELVVKKCVQTIGVEQGSIMLVSEDSAAPLKTLIRGADQHQNGLPYRLGVSLTGWILKNQQPLLIDNLGADRRFREVKARESGIRSVLSVPLRLKNRLIGVINLINKKEGCFTKEEQRLLSIIAAQSAQVIENARLYEEEREKQRIEQDLKMAHTIQMGLLPRENPQLVGTDIVGISFPAREVGGDYYDFIRLDDARLGIAIGDVSGKGVSAALLMSNLQAALRGQAAMTDSVKESVAKVNSLLHHSTDSEKFVTLIYGVLDVTTRLFKYTNAGHNPPIVLDRQGQWQRLDVGGVLLSLFDNYAYNEGQVQLNPGDLILFYSDGITEAENERGEQFEEKRLIQIAQKYYGLNAEELTNKIVNAVQDFTGKMPQQDDITLVVLKIT